MSNDLKITIVIATFNSRRYLEDLVASLKAQTDQRFACFFVDDGSRDDGPDFLESQISGHAEWKVYRKPAEGLPSKTFNFGARLAVTPWVMFLGSDDLLHPEAIATYNRAVEAQPDASMIVPEYTDFFFGERLPWRSFNPSTVPLESQDFLPSLLLRNELTASGALMNKARFAEIGYYPEDRQFKIGEDYFIWLRLASKGPGIKLKAELVHICKHDSNVSSNKENLASGLEAIGLWFKKEGDQRIGSSLLAQAYKTRGLARVAAEPAPSIGWLLKSLRERVRGDTLVLLSAWPLLYLIKKRIVRVSFLDKKLGIRDGMPKVS